MMLCISIQRELCALCGSSAPFASNFVSAAKSAKNRGERKEFLDHRKFPGRMVDTDVRAFHQLTTTKLEEHARR